MTDTPDIGVAISSVIDELVTAAAHFNYGDAARGQEHLGLASILFADMLEIAPGQEQELQERLLRFHKQSMVRDAARRQRPRHA